ncbi:MAG: hypothetical protein A3G97_10305 [Candidatus Rokubacteria bacterium RIFCSPLOWO2_12_FULL_69_21]|nr:MAG: hypothetical protein A3G97_10305 [Candidatus Rokubacteria bacterium RIFCSPLOWO2_12_FULL_69_21]
MWRIGPGGVKPALLAGLGLLTGCMSPGPAAVRHPDYRPANIRRPAVVLQVSGEFASREPTAISDPFEAGLIDALNGQGVLPLDVAVSTSRTLDRDQALARARSLRADALLLVEMRLERKDVVYCRETRRPFAARSTVLAVTLEVLRVADGTRLLLEPPDADHPLTDIEAECGREPSVRRVSLEELAGAGISRALTLLMRR